VRGPLPSHPHAGPDRELPAEAVTHAPNLAYHSSVSEGGGRRHGGWRATYAIVFALAGSTVTAHAADAGLDRAAELIGAHQADAAYAELAPQEVVRAGEPRFDHLLGLAALDSGHVTQAILALERVLARQPGNQPARAELARAYLAAGET
jgi:predicted Zn-dependent protease